MPASSARLCVSAWQNGSVKQFTGGQRHGPLSQIHVGHKESRVVVFFARGRLLPWSRATHRMKRLNEQNMNTRLCCVAASTGDTGAPHMQRCRVEQQVGGFFSFFFFYARDRRRHWSHAAHRHWHTSAATATVECLHCLSPSCFKPLFCLRDVAAGSHDVRALAVVLGCWRHPCRRVPEPPHTAVIVCLSRIGVFDGGRHRCAVKKRAA